jgi:hypothetical protein
VLKLFEQHHKPFNVQHIVDWLAQFGVLLKKAQVQNALDALVESSLCRPSLWPRHHRATSHGASVLLTPLLSVRWESANIHSSTAGAEADVQRGDCLASSSHTYRPG